jgi:GT2 family glycosyltransferase/glycosyltransferase involved in cell wall biosynthesis
MTFNPLEYPICWSTPHRLVETAWADNLPFAMFLVELLHPESIVELGTYKGVSYCGFCQAVKELRLDTRCCAVDTWEGDPHSGTFGAEVLTDLRRYHDPLYGEFSRLIQSTFDEASDQFKDGTIDLLHIDGYHTYEAVKHDFERWLPKLSPRGVVLMHDILVRERNFGVWKVWAELQQQYPSFELLHGAGVGLLAVGPDTPPPLRDFLAEPPDARRRIQRFFAALGLPLQQRVDTAHELAALKWRFDDVTHRLTLGTQQLEAQTAEAQRLDGILTQRDQAIEWLKTERDGFRSQGEAATQTVHDIMAQLEAARTELAGVRAELVAAQAQAAATGAALDAAQAQRDLARSDADTLRAQLDVERQLRDAAAVEQQTLRDRARDISVLQDIVTKTEAAARDRDEAIAWLKTELAEARQARARVQALNDSLSDQLHEILGSKGWRWLTRYRRVKERIGPQRGHRARPRPALPAVIAASTIASDAATPPPAIAALATGPTPAPVPDSVEALTLLPALQPDEAARVLGHMSDGERHRADIICFAIIDWEFRYQRPQQMMSQFAEHGHRVFYISPSRFSSSGSPADFSVRPIKENVYEVQVVAARTPDIYGEVIGGANADTMLESLAELRRTYDISPAVVYVMIASWSEVAREAAARWRWPLVYDCMDEWENFQGIKPALIEAETGLVRACDLLVVSAGRLEEKWRSYGKPTVLARNGVDYAFYSTRCRPNALLADAAHPIVGYFGAIAEWFDIDLLAQVARQRPQYTFVLLGGVFGVDVSGLKALPNVMLLGQQPYATMPQYLYHFDVCIIPFKVNAITEATDPVKLYEYLSVGKPVVSVRLPEVEPYGEHVYLANDPHDFVAKLDRAVAEDDRELAARRREFASQHTWTDRYLRIRSGLRDATELASIVIVTYNNMALTQTCLESILRNTGHPNYEVIVVDNASTDGTRPYLRHMAERHPEIRAIINATNLGFAHANNQGLAASRGAHLVLLNNDTVVPGGWLSRLIQHLRDPQIGLVGPVTNFVGNEARVEVTYSTWAEMERYAADRARRFDGQVADIDMLAMFCVAMRRDTLERVGPLDERFGIGMFEDDDYSQRVRAIGQRVVCAADAFVHHVGQAAFKKLIENGEYNDLFDRNRRAYEEKWKVVWRRHEHAPLAFAPSRPAAAHAATPTALERT